MLRKPTSTKVRSLRKSNAKIRERIIRVPGAVGVLRAAGFIDDGDNLQLHMQVQSSRMVHPLSGRLAASLSVLREAALAVGVDSSTIPTIPSPLPTSFVAATPAPAPPVDFDAFSSKVDRVVPQPRGGVSTTEKRVSMLQSKMDKMVEDAGLPERRTCVRGKEGHSVRGGVSAQLDSLDGPSDATIVARSIKAKMEKHKLSGTLRTKAQRDLTELQRKRVYTETCIRIQFPRPHDAIVLESHFSPIESVQAVMDVIRNSLAPAFAQLDFELYLTPPRRVLKPNALLRDEKLVPSALVRLSWKGGIEPASLAADLISSAVPTEGSVLSFPSSVALDEEHALKQKRMQTALSSRSTGNAGKKKSSSGKKPKWFKL